ncbi:hypothetical protein [uncultured Paraglaciecola sp.]|uniref:hypothetical protein n=1 Tax=uncultured Paraglaciecola sp. TaxID=1765024 RepID=UPI0026244843|nr:hypothetical protein [uncultured Paraglaciecola sp.]
MIDRGFSHDAITALQQSEVAVLLFVDIDWPGGRVRAHTGLGTRTFQGQDYIGVGEFGGVSEVVEAANNSPNQIRLTLKVLDASVVGLVMNNSPEGREVAVHMAVLNDDRVIEHEVPFVVDGNVASFDIQRGDLSKDIPYVMQITCSDWFERWSRPPESARTTDSAQQHLHPGDRIFDLTEVIAAAPLSAMPMKNVTDWEKRREEKFG